MSKDFGGGGQTHQSVTLNNPQVATMNQTTTEEQKQNNSHLDDVSSTSQVRAIPFPLAPLITFVEGFHENINFYLEYERVYLVRDQGPIVDFSHD